MAVLWRAVVVMCGAWAIGHIIGFFAHRTLGDYVTRYKSQHPIVDPHAVGSSIADQTRESRGVPDTPSS